MCPCLTRYHHLANASAGIPADSHNFLTPCAPRRAQSRRARRPPCSDPWPSCYQHHSDQKRSCLDGRSGQMDRTELSPSCLARDQPRSTAEHTCHLHECNTNSLYGHAMNVVCLSLLRNGLTLCRSLLYSVLFCYYLLKGNTAILGRLHATLYQTLQVSFFQFQIQCQLSLCKLMLFSVVFQ